MENTNQFQKSNPKNHDFACTPQSHHTTLHFYYHLQLNLAQPTTPTITPTITPTPTPTPTP
jgi:hypothetical protein